MERSRGKYATKELPHYTRIGAFEFEMIDENAWRFMTRSDTKFIAKPEHDDKNGLSFWLD